MSNIEDNISLINQALGSGGIWKAKCFSESNLSKLLAAISIVHTQIKNYQNDRFTELNIYKATENSIEMWEQYVGIPDAIFNKTTNLGLADRIRQVALKLIGFENMTLPRLKFILNDTFGISNIEVSQGTSVVCFPITFGVFRFGTKQSARQDLYINLPATLATEGFPFKFPFKFQESQRKTIESFIKMVTSFEYNIYFDYTLA